LDRAGLLDSDRDALMENVRVSKLRFGARAVPLTAIAATLAPAASNAFALHDQMTAVRRQHAVVDVRVRSSKKERMASLR
jgi:hypothetical protein